MACTVIIPTLIATATKISIPDEIVDIIADYRDYDKYCKPQHKELYEDVMVDIVNMGGIMVDNILPSITRSCWGAGRFKTDVDQYDEYWQEIQDNLDMWDIIDDEEDNGWDSDN
tara:strand:+ start:344 stop:685 length:342 start_codon:yes stop_codon:yes gene_type:complete